MNKIIFHSLPIDGPLRVTSKFGPRNTGITGASTIHKGIDLGGDKSKPQTNLLSVASGKIKTNKWNKYRGWYIVISCDGFDVLYQHMRDKCPLALGASVKVGQIIGVMGHSSDTTVLKTATHLHFELHLNGVPIDPFPYLQNIQKEVVEVIRPITIMENGVNKKVDSINILGHEFIQITDLNDSKIKVGYDSVKKIITING